MVNGLRDFFTTQEQSRRFRLAAYTSVAARDIGGATLHSLLQLNDQSFDVAAGVVNGSHGILRKIRYTLGEEGRRYLNSCVVEVSGSDDIDMPDLPEHHFPIFPDTTELKFEHGASHRRCTIRRKHVPIEPGFAMTAHKAQGKPMERVVVDLAGCIRTEAPYMVASRATSLSGSVALRPFDIKQIRKRRSEELRREFIRPMIAKWRT